MRRYSHLAWSGSRGWVRTICIALSLPVVGGTIFGILMAIVEVLQQEAVIPEVSSLPWTDQLLSGTGLHLVVLITLAFTQRAFRRRTLRSYLTASERLRLGRLGWGSVAGVGIAVGGLLVGLMFGFIRVGGPAEWSGWFVGAVLILVPLQVAVEEVVRGVLLQTGLKWTRRGWAAIVGSSLVMALLARAAAAGLGLALSGWVVFVLAFGIHGIAAVVALLEDGLELVMGARAGMRAVLLLGLGMLPLQGSSMGGVGVLLVILTAGTTLVGARWAGWGVYGLVRSIRRFEPPDLTREPEAETVDYCLNCGADLVGPYCHECGQKGVDRNRSLKVLLPEVFDAVFEVDSRIWRTVRILLTRPGLLSRYYNGGRREEFVRPFRLYIAFSFLFFLTLISFPPGSSYEPFAAWTDESAAEGFQEGFAAGRGEINVNGAVDAVNRSDSTLTVEGIPFAIAPGVDLQGDLTTLDSVSVGRVAFVEGHRENGTLVARELSLADTDHTHQPEMTGPVEYVGEQSLTLVGTTVRITDSTEFEDDERLGAFQAGDRVDVEYETIDGTRTATEVELAEGVVDRIMEGDTTTLRALIQNYSRAMFFLVPLFGLLVQALYVREPYVGHLIFALHEHAYMFFVGTLVVLVGLMPGAFTWLVENVLHESVTIVSIGTLMGLRDWASRSFVWIAQVVLVGTVPFYLVSSLRTTYDESWLGATVKSLFLLAAYAILLLFGVGFTVGYLSM